MNFIQGMQRGVLVTLIMTGTLAFAGTPSKAAVFLKSAIDGAAEQKQELHKIFAPNPFDLLKTLPSMADVKVGVADGLTRVRGIEYRKNAEAAWNYVTRNYARGIGFVQTCWSGMRKRYWQSPVILPEHQPEHQDNNLIDVFGSVEDETVFTCPVTDGYIFLVPESAIDEDFLFQTAGTPFESIVHKLKYNGITISSRVMYLLCTIRQLQLSDPEVYCDVPTLFHANQQELGRIALQLRNKELFDAIKACRYLKITNSYFLNMLSYVVAHALCSKYPLAKIEKILDSGLVFFEEGREMLVRSLRDIVMRSEILGKGIIQEASNDDCESSEEED